MSVFLTCLIRKNSSWTVYAIPWFIATLCLFFAIISPILFIIVIINPEWFIWTFSWENIEWGNSQNALLFFIFAILCIWNIMFRSIKIFRSLLKINNAKKFKKSWWWIIKKIKITSIKFYNNPLMRNWFKWYYLESKNGEITYFSDGIQEWKIDTVGEEKKSTESWNKISFLKLNWFKISVWDTVDVYIDPKDEKIYWMDIDFLFDK